MSYVPRFTLKGLAGLRNLDPWLQEETLDEIELLAEGRIPLARRGRSPGLVHDFTRSRGGTTHYVFVIVGYEAPKVLKISDIGHFARPELPPAG